MQITEVFGFPGVATILVFYIIWRISNWLWFKPKKIEQSLRDQGLKGSPYKFFFGDVKEMEEMQNEAMSKPMNLSHDISSRVLPFFYKFWVATHGDNFFTWIGTTPVVHVTEPTLVREVYLNYRKFLKATGNPLRKLLAAGLFFTEGDQWAKHRKIINPAFHVEKLKHMGHSFYESCSEMMDKWEELMTGESSCEVDVLPYFCSFSADVISRTAFGSSFKEGRKIFELQKEQAEMMEMIDKSLYVPGSRFLPTKNNKRIKEIAREVRAIIYSIIDKRVAAMKSGEITSKDDLLGMLLDCNNKEIKEGGNKSFGLSNEDIFEECKLFYFAGQDTTAFALIWTMVLLSQHKDWQTRAREEISHVFGERRPDIHELNQLKIMTMILNEVQRLYPVATATRRLIHEEVKLGNLTLPAGTIIQLNNMFFHHDKKTWGEDASEFNPQRFSEGVSKAMKQGQVLYLPFGIGPRICIGQNFAMLEMKMALAMILQRFSFDLSPSYSHAPQTMISLQPQFGAHLILHKL